MKKLVLIALMVTPLFFISCSDDDDTTEVSTTYTLDAISDSGVSGTAKFVKVDSVTTRVELQLQNTVADTIHPAHIHINDAVTGGGIAITLNNVDGNTGSSITTVTKLDDEGDTTGEAINYEGLLAFDGHINVHLSPTELQTIVAQGNIGSNVQ
ncbi:hypothetical protein U6A24_09020 [Aquimarina gracilis]|uniref:CHRD domain-containing protein n=1 Tax=Aquimarina gracilis TaxID=874422 RepID=A0ABU5ZU42_9FLAO|nr:hypothetical protein [Aquimarina gracilis]MEB3345599.1 hypothetical protein [Aquimarina gracilis]